MKVSVIICVYNGDAYIERAIRSVLAQTMSDFQLIIVDDGSTDKTAEIIDAFAKEDERIEVIHQHNGGVAIARQKGIDSARGEYLMFVDADDWIDETTLERLLAKAEETDADMLWMDAMFCTLSNGEINKRYKKIDFSENKDESIRRLLSWDSFGALWLWFFKTSLFYQPMVYFPKRSVYAEDLPVIVSALLYAQKIAYLPEAHYHYYFANSASLTNQRATHLRLDCGIIPAIRHMEQAFKTVQGADKYLEPLMRAKLFTIRNYVDDNNLRDYFRFVNTFPDAIEAMQSYPTYPRRLKQIAWCAKHRHYHLANLLRRFYGLLRRFHLSDIGAKEWIKCQ